MNVRPRRKLLDALCLGVGCAMPSVAGPPAPLRHEHGDHEAMFECEIVDDGLRSFGGPPWPEGYVPFVFDPDANITTDERVSVLTAMDWWTTTTGVKFVYRGGEDDYVLITRNDQTFVSRSQVGVQGGQQRLWVGSSHWGDSGVLAHELGHTLGFYHEQSRPDRDDYVTIHVSNIDPDHLSNFDIKPWADTFGHPYDYESILHYGSCSFSNCGLFCFCVDVGCRTMSTVDPDAQCTIGQRSQLSTWDILDMRALYGVRHARYVTDGGSGLGTLADPFGSLPAAMGLIPDGTTLLIRTGNYGEPGAFSRPGEWRAHGGSAVLGVP